ncbi:Rpn family recombination-promoting nuclease/putative transposase [Beggiatoa leptomitoformis]|uniref:Transposase (putative) YhgA-like domain-containing protein n=1 Tax=Beggiatoa leptomitoformis TaxID=288004 RepID=A0A2N9YH18_9GAMM|nr:Rpn family recombination-promoting nuclease/putative transposase [Beggiatoa leptomitoformis]ALG67928.1 hypothetical protein AL038_09670 [Beggiatoa leptomitoformis]AUI69800.1 hypothetical protein BLE401_14600 [Beggiatoa leptomitoformis]
MNLHDTSYKLLFSYPEMVKDLLTGFVHEKWVENVDFNTLEPYKTDFISEKFHSRNDDLIWRVRYQENWLYIYIILEFQSSIDDFMAIRLWVYIGLLYQHLIKTEKLNRHDKLPPVLPLVLYNGNQRWNAPISLDSLIHPAPEGLAQYRPQLHYLLIDELAYQDAELSPLKNLVAALFRMENSRNHEQADTIIVEVIKALADWLDSPEQAGLKRAFVAWLKQIYLPRHLPNTPMPVINELEEVRIMLEERVQQWYAEGMQIGVQQGLQQGEYFGLQRGRQEEKQRDILMILEIRFGELPLSLVEQVKSMTEMNLLETCLKQAVLVESLTVFCEQWVKTN